MITKPSTHGLAPDKLTVMASERVQKALAVAREVTRDLTNEERVEFADEICRELDPDTEEDLDPNEYELDIDAQELKRRLDEVHSGAVKGIPAEQVHAEIRAELEAMYRR